MAKDIQRIEDLTPDANNANTGTERGVYMVETSLEKLGAGRSIVVDEQGRVIAGNKTLQAAIEKGFDIQVVRTDGKKLVVVQREDLDLSDPKGAARQLAFADNRSSEVGLAWNPEQLLADMNAGVDFGDWFAPDEIEALLAGIDQGEPAQDPGAQVDRAAELQKIWQVQRGQVWEVPSKSVDGKCHRVMCGDSTNPDDVARLMGGQKAKLFATDPPYGVAYGVETGINIKYGAIANDENDGPRLQTFLEKCFLSWLPYLEVNAAWYLWHAQMTQGFFAAAAAAADVIIHRQIIWVKPSLILGHGHYHWRHELCFYGWRRGNQPEWYGDRSQTTVWEVGRQNDGVHPTQKPTELFTGPLAFNTLKGNICADPFLGSGTTIVACEQTGRVGYGMEISPEYCAVTLQRLQDMGLEPRVASSQIS